MIIGHLGIAFIARRRWPRVSLAWLVGASLAPDLSRPILYVVLRMNSDRGNYYTHTVPWSLVFAVCLGLIALRVLRERDALVAISLVVMSHVGLDMISGFKPLWRGGPIGLDFEHFQQMEFLVEGAIFLLGWIAIRQTSVPRWVTTWGFLMAGLVGEGAYLTVTLGERPYLQRCPAYPIRDCDEQHWYTKKWNTGIVPLSWISVADPSVGAPDV